MLYTFKRLFKSFVYPTLKYFLSLCIFVITYNDLPYSLLDIYALLLKISKKKLLFFKLIIIYYI